MIREVTRDDIPVCVDIIRKSFKTVSFYSQIKDIEPIAEIDEKLLGFFA